MVIAWRNFINIFSRPLFTIIFRPEILKFHQYSILTGDTMVEFVIYCMLLICTYHQYCIPPSPKVMLLATKLLPNFDVSNIGDNFAWPLVSPSNLKLGTRHY